MSAPDTSTPQVHANDARWDIVLRVAASAGFQRSPRLRELLLYICERAILNRPEELREQQIGCGVFGRKPDYSPGEDNIVRVEVRHLRKRLEEYFLGEGKDEPVVIVVPKGAYVPSFEPREAVYPAPAPASASEPAPAPVSAPPAQPAPSMPPPRRRDWVSLQMLVIIALAAACLLLWQQNRTGANHTVMAAGGSAVASELWPLLFNQEHPTQIVCADSTLVVAQLLLHRRVRLPEFLSGEYSGLRTALPAQEAILRHLPHWQFTDMADLRLVQRLSAANANHWGNVTVHSAKTTEIQDFKNGNIVLLGSNRSNPWNDLFEPTLNFVVDFDEDSQTPLVRNKAPQPGEQPEYRAASPGVAGVAYSTVALVPNLRRTGNVIIIAGTTGEATEATGEFLTDPKASAVFCGMLMRRNQSRMPYFEALLRSATLAGIAKSPEVVAVRILSGDPAGV